MGRLSRQLADPWTTVAAVLAGGVAWGVALPVLAAVGVGAAVAAAKVGAGLLTDAPDEPPVPAGPPPPSPGSPEAVLLGRAEAAAARVGRTVGGLGATPGALADQLRTVGAGVAATLGEARTVAADCSALGAALAGLPDERVLQPRSEAERASVAETAAVRQRLLARRQARLDALAAGAAALEELSAKATETTTLLTTEGPDPSAGDVRRLLDQLDGVRAGLAEVSGPGGGPPA